MGHYTGMVLLDLQKAFDTVNHDILLSKMNALGVNVNSVGWFRSYLSGRKQVVDVSGTMSSECNITCGVPQGSILGPLLFLIYVNDMPAAVKCKLMLYADDSALLVSGKVVSEIETVLSAELAAVQEWLIDNKLSLHLGKTESILFASKGRLQKHNSIQVRCGGNDIESKQDVTYLGVTLDQSLSGENIVNKTVTKCSNKVKFLYRNARNFDKKTKKLLVSALIQCHFDYACTSWYSGLTKKSKSRLQVAQNKVIRFMLNLPPRSHIGAEEFEMVGLLPVEKRVGQLKLSHVYNIFHSNAPVYMKSNFHISNSRTRNSVYNFNITRVGSFSKDSFYYTGAKLWNDLPLSVRSSQTRNGFKNSIKKHFMSQVLVSSQSDFIYY